MEGHLFRFQWVSHAWAFLARGRSFSFISFLRLGKQNHMKMAVLTKTCTRAQARKRNCQFVSSVGNNPSTFGETEAEELSQVQGQVGPRSKFQTSPDKVRPYLERRKGGGEGTRKATTKQLNCRRVSRSISPSFSLLFLDVKQGIIYPCMGNMYMPTVPKAQSLNGLQAQAGTLPPHRPSVSPALSQTSSVHTQTGSILVTTKATLTQVSIPDTQQNAKPKCAFEIVG